MTLFVRLFTLLLLPVLGQAQLTPEPLAIPMRDGKFLAADLYRPANTGTYPVILIQTPYNKAGFQLTGLPLGTGFNIASSQYAFVVVDWRCYFASLSACTLSPARGEDGYDAVEWIAEQPWCNGKVGTWGPSALGGIQYQTAREQPPHLVCAVPLVASPQTRYDNFFPGGAARVDYIGFVGPYFGLQSIVAANPYYNPLWQFSENPTLYPEAIEIPMFLIGGWFDINTDDNLRMFDTLVKASAPAVRSQHRLLMGPWTHNRIGNPLQGEMNYPAAANKDDELALAFFDYHLRGLNNGWDNSPSVQYYQTGEDEWRSTPSWPPADTETEHWCLQADASLMPNALGLATAVHSFSYDPQNPSPSIGGKLFTTDILGNNTGPIDISGAVESRSDALLFTSAPLTEAVVVQGSVQASLFFSSNRIDTDLALRLTDVLPDGRSIIIGETLLRLHFREGSSIADTVYMTPGVVYPVQLNFEAIAYTFQPGHRIRLVVTSSNYPRYNRNMNTGGPMYPGGNIDTLVNPLIAQNQILTGANYPSALVLPLMAQGSATSVADALPEITVWPVPARELVRFWGLPADCRWTVLDITGKIKEQGTASGNLTLNVAGWQPGTWLLQVTGEKSFRAVKFIKQ